VIRFGLPPYWIARLLPRIASFQTSYTKLETAIHPYSADDITKLATTSTRTRSSSSCQARPRRSDGYPAPGPEIEHIRCLLLPVTAALTGLGGGRRTVAGRCRGIGLALGQDAVIIAIQLREERFPSRGKFIEINEAISVPVE
jgi:hypothetical protein